MRGNKKNIYLIPLLIKSYEINYFFKYFVLSLHSDADSNTNINLTKDAPPYLTDSLLRNSSVPHTTDSEDGANRVSDGTDTRLVVGASIGAFLLILVVTGLIAASR